MAVQDLTPQLRTRLGRIEKLVGWFVTVATLLLLTGLGYYIYHLAQNKGWTVNKASYYTYLKSAGGIHEGDKILLMGRAAGEIVKIKPMPPESTENIYVEFDIFGENIGYIWDDSRIKVLSSGLFGRYLEVTKGGTRVTNDVHATFKEEHGRLTGIWSRDKGDFVPWKPGEGGFELYADEPPELGPQIDQTVEMLKISLTNILQLTNALAKTLQNAADAAENANSLLRDAKPVLRNVTTITDNLKEPNGSLGEWLIPLAMNQQLRLLLTNANVALTNAGDTLVNANSAVTNANTNLVVVFANITAALENFANITSNLNAQVQANGHIVSSVSRLIVDTDDFVQGLKRHWLLRSAFKETGEPPPSGKTKPNPGPRPSSPKGGGR